MSKFNTIANHFILTPQHFSILLDRVCILFLFFCDFNFSF